MDEDWRNGGFGIYLHWPFCSSKCPYCDFNSHVAAEIDQKLWADAYISALESYHREVPDRVVNSLFFGGGTPSLMDPDTVAAVIDKVHTLWPTANDLEITLEANPSSVQADGFAGFRLAGVNRISIGVQALNDGDLRRLGRVHSVDQAMRAVDIAQSLFDRVSFDLIYARQDQSLADWEQELSRAIAMGTDHLSLYQLSIEDGTVFGERHRQGKLRGLPDDNLSADLYEVTQGLCDAAGLGAYEVSNHARGDAVSRHNLIYWRSGDYLGIGPGAHGRLTVGGVRFATETPMSPDGWLAGLRSRHGELSRTALSRSDHAGEYVMMASRLSEGLEIARLDRLAPQLVSSENCRALLQDGFLEVDDLRLTVTPKGRILLNSLLKKLLVEIV